ncbi:MAG: hypothetical protein PGN08_00480 [Sphingomonas taxi]
MRHFVRPLTLAILTLCAAPAAAQVAVDAGVEAASDEARRGLSWSGGRATASADVVATRGALEASARLVTTRGAARHGGADAVGDLTLAGGWNVGAIRLRAQAAAHLFAGAQGRMDYVELGGSASYGYGPLYLTGGAMLAPSQAAIGGSNLYVFARASAGIPGTPLTLIGDIGHSSGTTGDPARAQRLRPGGDYADWRLGLEHRRDGLTLGVDYVGTDVARADAFGPYADARHAGDRIVGRVRFDF